MFRPIPIFCHAANLLPQYVPCNNRGGNLLPKRADSALARCQRHPAVLVLLEFLLIFAWIMILKYEDNLRMYRPSVGRPRVIRYAKVNKPTRRWQDTSAIHRGGVAYA
jgi:hypothetical protein